jgi:transposase
VNRASKHERKPLPAHLPRETRKVLPKQEACPDCGGELKPFGEDVSEMLEWVPEHFKVIRQVRPKLSCAGCDKIVQAEGASRPIRCLETSQRSPLETQAALLSQLLERRRFHVSWSE